MKFMFEDAFMQISRKTHIERSREASHYVNRVSAAFARGGHKCWKGSFDFARSLASEQPYFAQDDMESRSG
ncbi:MAG: hypothetical protein NVS1B11_29860 [Terriglobales bacterium]